MTTTATPQAEGARQFVYNQNPAADPGGRRRSDHKGSTPTTANAQRVRRSLKWNNDNIPIYDLRGGFIAESNSAGTITRNMYT